MNKKVFYYELGCALITILLGFLFHFAFDWLNKWKPLALFFSVNESVWEHCKIGFWPAFFTVLAEYFFIKDNVTNFFAAKAALLLTLPVLIIVLFYTYSGILGYNILIVDIAIFFIAVFISYYISYRLLTSETLSKLVSSTSAAVIVILLLAFSTLTFVPGSIALFKDPQSGLYGIH